MAASIDSYQMRLAEVLHANPASRIGLELQLPFREATEIPKDCSRDAPRSASSCLEARVAATVGSSPAATLLIYGFPDRDRYVQIVVEEIDLLEGEACEENTLTALQIARTRMRSPAG